MPNDDKIFQPYGDGLDEALLNGGEETLFGIDFGRVDNENYKLIETDKGFIVAFNGKISDNDAGILRQNGVVFTQAAKGYIFPKAKFSQEDVEGFVNEIKVELEQKAQSKKEEETPQYVAPKVQAVKSKPVSTDYKAIQYFEKIVDDILLKNNVFLYGGAGTGKTTIANLVAQFVGLEVQTINCSQWTSPIEIIGGQTIEGYQEGKLIEAYRRGNMLILDEMPKIDPNTAGLLNEALAKAGNKLELYEQKEVEQILSKTFAREIADSLYKLSSNETPENFFLEVEKAFLKTFGIERIKDLDTKQRADFYSKMDNTMPQLFKNPLIQNSRKERFVKHPSFCVVGAGNTYPNTTATAYGANNKQDLSLLDRFAGSVYRIEKNPKLEKQIVGLVWLWEYWDKLRTVIEEQKYEAQVSLRVMQVSVRVFLNEMDRVKRKDAQADSGKTLKDVFDSFLTSGFTEEQTMKLINSIPYNSEIEKYQYRTKF